ncbi:MAG: hypothetical protein F6K40_03270 [Okeania sp. SIO3I5]|uniref:element excision factor XisH family protein n=1 Tax=Okeania sp. SIO3I5 TaxID=2607805 RepID=UPI0013B74F9C|nr:element excision factor XisH family protein [Okeania sp. SIO3I5]NEQ35381.1 hypothetical protein [Okeania sp. SIO3I5]
MKSALIKDGWKITDDPLFIKPSTKISLYIDIGGERAIGAQKDGHFSYQLSVISTFACLRSMT